MTKTGVLFATMVMVSSASFVACGGNEVSTTSTSSAASGMGGDAASTSSAGGAGGMAAASSSTGIGDPSDMYPAKHQPAPHVEDYGGAVLASPEIVPIFFSNDDPTYVSGLTDFANQIGASSYWAAVASEYGVGAAAAHAAVNLTEAAPTSIDDTGIQEWLGAKLNADDPLFATPNANTIYLINYPAGSTIDLGQGQLSCQSFGGYHSNFALDAAHGNMQVAYAVIPRCPDFAGVTGIDAITATSSHELIEASTDPYPMTSPAYAEVDVQHIYWERLLGGGEVGDMCAQFPDVFVKFPDFPWTVQRSWSNQAAAAGKDPCVPELDGEVYFNAAPALKDNVAASIFGQAVTVKGVNIPVGETKTIDVNLFSEGDTGGPWTVEAMDGSFGSQNPHLELSLDEDQGQNGQTLHLTIHVLSTGKNKTANFILHSSKGNQDYVWFGIVGSPDP